MPVLTYRQQRPATALCGLWHCCTIVPSTAAVAERRQSHSQTRRIAGTLFADPPNEPSSC